MLDENKEEKVLKEACVRLCQLFGEGIQNDRIQAILEANVVPKLVALLRPSRARAVPISVQSAALQVLGNVACGDDRQTQVVIDSDALPCLRALLASADRGIRKEVCWIVSNITESSHQVQDVLDADILPPLLKLLDNQDAACREDATWVLFNLSSNREPRQISYLADKNGVRALCNLLTCSKDLDVLWKGCGTVAAVALKGLRNILICGQNEAATDPLGYNRMAALVAEAHGVERIEALTQHASHDVRLRARLLLERMFGAERTTVDLAALSAGPASTVSSALASPPPPPPIGHTGCSCSYQHHSHHPHAHHYPPGTYDAAGAHPAALGQPVDQNGLHPHNPLVEPPGSTSASSTDSDPEDEDEDSELIPQPPEPCCCVLCTDASPLSERRPRGKPVGEESEQEVRPICDFCSGSGRLGDGRAGLAAKLGRAVRLGHSHCIAILLSRMTWSQRGAAIDAPAILHPGGGPTAGGFGHSLPAITLAAQLGKPECLSLLLRRCKPDLNQTFGKRRYTPLAWAASKGYVRCTELLIEHGSDPATKCAEGITALHLAASGGGNETICKLLLDYNAPANALTEKKQTPLCLAAQKGHFKIVQLLLHNGANPNNEDVEKYTPLHLAASSGYQECLKLLLCADAVVDCKTLKGITPLHYAVQGGHAACVRLLINAGAKVNCAKKPLLLIAAEDGKPEVVQILLDALAVIDCRAYIKAFLDKDNEISDYLTPLHLASSKGNQEVVEQLLRRGASVDAVTDNSKWTPLDFAVLNGHSGCAVVLLKHGATVSDNCKNIGRNNWTLVQYAASHGAKEVVRLLVQRLKEQRMKAKGAKFTPTSPEIPVTPTHDMQTASGMLPPLVDPIPFHAVAPAPVHGPGGICNGNPCSESPTHAHHHPGATVRPCNHILDKYQPHLGDEYLTAPAVAPVYESRGISEKRCNHPHDGACGNGNAQAHAPLPEQNSGTRRRAPKEDRETARRARELKKREMEAAEARERLDEAISQRSIAKLTEAISHVSKLVLHLATSGGSDATGQNGVGAEYGDDGYGPFADPNGVPPANGAGNGRHPPPGGPTSYATHSTPLPVEVGLGNEVMKARKMLNELQIEERRARDERAREAADNKRDNAQQSVLKAMTATLQGGDSRILVRTVNRALRTILDSDDEVILEAKRVSKKIEVLEKAELELNTGKQDRNLSLLTKVIPIVEIGLKEVRAIDGQGAAERIFGPSGPEIVIKEAKALCEELIQEKRAAEELRAKAEDKERQAKDKLTKALTSGDLKLMETTIDDAAKALISKNSDLSNAIDTAKKSFAKILKGERRKLRQANATNNADTIDAAVDAATAKGLKSLETDIEASREKAQKIRNQKRAKEDLEDAISNSDVSVLMELRIRLKSLGMFAEEERARAEVDTLQRAARARSLLETEVSNATENLEALKKKKGSKNKDSDANRSAAEWDWPDTQRLYDLSLRSRKYGSAMEKLCDSAILLLKSLGNAGREIVRSSINSDDATVIAAAISGYEKSFMNSSYSTLFNKDAGTRVLAEARRRLAAVQADDQEKVRRESAQVKTEYQQATARRHAVKHRGSRNRSNHNQSNSASAKDSVSVTPNASSKLDNRCAESNNSSEYGGDDEASDLDGASSTSTKEVYNNSVAWGKNADRSKHNGQRRPRAPTARSVDEQIASEPGADNYGGNVDCAHYYLHQEGTTVFCGHCGNLRSTANPDWLTRVKRRGHKMPVDMRSPVSPPNLGMTPPTSVRPPVMGNSMLQSNPPLSSLGGQSRGVNHMPARVPPALVGALPIGQQPMGLTGGMPIGPPQMTYMHHHQLPVSGPVPMVKRSKPGGATQHRSRARPHDLNASVGLENLNRGSTLYGRNPMGAASLGMASSANMRYSQMGYQSDMVGSMDRQGASGIVPLSTGLPVSNMYGVSAGMRQRMPVSPVGTTSGTHHSLSLLRRSHIGTNQGMTMGMSGNTRAGNHAGNGVGSLATGVGGMTGDDFTSESTDLGVEFASQNFGFDIDAIVDDNPEPPELKVGGARVSDVDVNSAPSPNDYF